MSTIDVKSDNRSIAPVPDSDRLSAGWSVEDGLVPALQGPLSTGLLGGADLSWLVGIVVAGGLYLVLEQRAVAPAAAR